MKEGYYVYMETISDADGKRTVKQAIDYITDDHDSKRLGTIDDQMIAYICRLDPGYKTEHEGGRVPLIGHGRLETVTDLQELTEYFNTASFPRDNRGKKGYKSITLTVPKNLTGLCETDKNKTREAITAAINSMLPQTYEGKQLWAVSAMHTRNKAGELHYHVHLLIAKFIKDTETGKFHSINYDGAYKNGVSRDAEKMKKHWKAEINKEIARLFDVDIRIGEKGQSIIRKKNGVEPEFMDRASIRDRQRAWEECNAPQIEDERTGMSKPFKINIMDAKILEVAKASEFNEANFMAVFPKQKYSAYENRAKSLQEVGYLDKNLKPTDAFRRHAEAMFGTRPEWKQIKEDVDNILGKLIEKTKEENPDAIPDLVEKVFTKPLELAMDIYPKIAERVQNISPNDSTTEQVQAQWTNMVKHITPELDAWRQAEEAGTKWKNDLAKLKNDLPKLKGDMTGELSNLNIKIITAEGWIKRYNKDSTAAWKKAEQASDNPILPERKTIIPRLQSDAKLHDDAKRQIISLTNKMNEQLKFTDEKNIPYVKRYYQNKIDDLTRVTTRLFQEIQRRRTRALQIEPTIPVRRSKYKLTGKKLGRIIMSPQTAQFINKKLYRRNNSLKAYLSGHSTAIRTDVSNLRRGFKVMEILGDKYAVFLRSWMVAGEERRLLQANEHGKLPKELSLAVSKAKEFGRVLSEAEFQNARQKPELPQQLKEGAKGLEAEKRALLLIARLTAMGLEVPDMKKYTAWSFIDLCKSNGTLNALTTEGSNYIINRSHYPTCQ